MKKFLEDFKKFITRGNVVDMAVGVAVATAFTAIVTAFTKGFITPLLALLTPVSDLSELKWIIRPEETNTLADGTVEVVTAEVALMWGAFVQKIIDFLIIAFCLFVVMRVAAAFSKRAQKIAEEFQKRVNAEELKAAAEKKAKEESEAKAKAAAEAEAKALEEQKAKEALRIEEERKKEEIALLREIRDYLAASSKQ